jgi:hypothetical protein
MAPRTAADGTGRPHGFPEGENAPQGANCNGEEHPHRNTYASVDESRARLHRAGWSVGEVATASAWVVTGTNGENCLHARGDTQAEAWWRACEQARAVGLLARPRERPGARRDG